MVRTFSKPSARQAAQGEDLNLRFWRNDSVNIVVVSTRVPVINNLDKLVLICYRIKTKSEHHILIIEIYRFGKLYVVPGEGLYI